MNRLLIKEASLTTPDIILPLSETQDTAKYFSRMNSDSHVNVHACCFSHFSKDFIQKNLLLNSLHINRATSMTFKFNLPYNLDHFKAHLDAIVSMCWTRYRQPGHAIVTIAQNLNSHAIELLGFLIELGKQSVENVD